MEEQKKKQIRNRILLAAMAVIAVALGYILYTAFVRKELGASYYIVLYGCLALFWFLTDVLTIVTTKGFEGKTEEQKKAYRIYAALNFAGLAGLGFFAFSINSSKGMIGAIVYVATLMTKRKYQEEYRGITPEPEEETADTEEEAPEALPGEEAQEAKTEENES